MAHLLWGEKLMPLDDQLLVAAILLPLIVLIALYVIDRLWIRLHDLVVILAMIVASAISASMLFHVSGWNAPAGFLDNFRISFAASFAEDLFFFTLFGCLIFYLQRQNWFAEKDLEDRINFLFNAKQLGSEERTYLKDAIAKCAADFQADKTTIELVEYQPRTKMLKLSVSRQFRIGNYLKEQNASYLFDAWIEADPMPDNRDAIEVFPISVQSLIPQESAKPKKLADKRFLNAHTKLKGGQIFEVKEQDLSIRPGHLIECYYRFDGWQPTAIEAPNSHSTAIEAPNGHYQISVKRHWDRMSMELVNRLQLEAEICVVGPDDAPSTYVLPPGHRTEERWEALNVAPNRTILIKFLAFRPHNPVVHKN
jgi:hypothetical protein